MEQPAERKPESGAGQNGKRTYEPPRIVSEEIFETTALACGKVPPMGGACNHNPKTS